MDIVNSILIQSGKIFSFVLIVFAFIVSFIILFKPKAALRLNDLFNKWYSTKQVSDGLEESIDTSKYFLKNRYLIGVMFFFGSLFTVQYLLFEFDLEKFIGLVIRPSGNTSWLFLEIGISVVRWVMVVFSLVGMWICFLLLFAPDRFQYISQKMDTAFSTRQLGDSLDKMHRLDNWVLRNHIPVGLFLFLGSSFLMVFFIFVWFK